MKRFLSSLIIVLLSSSVVGQADWAYWGSSHYFQRYSPAAQINSGNVSDLEIVWRRPAVDESITSAYPRLRVSGNLRATPIFINGVLYSSNGVGLAEAFDPASGETLWVQEPDEITLAEVQGQSSRGVEYWSDGSDEILFVIRKGNLIALNPKNGRRISSFGDNGRIDLVPESSNNFNGTFFPAT